MVAHIKADYCDVEKRYWFDRSFLMDVGVNLDVAVQVSTGADPRTGTETPSSATCAQSLEGENAALWRGTSSDNHLGRPWDCRVASAGGRKLAIPLCKPPPVRAR